jgi:hypothetical protein
VSATKGLGAALVSDLMMQAVAQKFGPDGGYQSSLIDSRTTAAATSQPRPRRMRSNSDGQAFDKPGMAESFVKTSMRDYANMAERTDSQIVTVQLLKWFGEYRSNCPHSALGYVPPKLCR